MTDPEVTRLVIALAQRAGDPSACFAHLADYRDQHDLATSLVTFELALAQTFGNCMTPTKNPGTGVPVTIPEERN